MKVYVAAPWTHKAEAQRYAEALEAAGHTITKKWWEHREVPGYLNPTIGDDELGELQQQAIEDISGVLDADAFVLINAAKSEGKAVESGVAIVSGLLLAYGHTNRGVTRFILVGGKSNLFHYSSIWRDATSPADVIAHLQ